MPLETTISDWQGRAIKVARSKGGVVAVTDVWDNVIRTDVRPWPPPELIQKIYQSRQARAFDTVQLDLVKRALTFYTDLQSIHSEDAITWSVFGPVAYAAPQIRTAFVRDFLGLIDIPGAVTNSHVWLWRRLPHPDTLVSGGPEIDFGIQTDDVFLLGEAKWRSAVGAKQGINRNKDQVTLRREFCQKYGTRLLSGIKRFVVLGVSSSGGIVPRADTEESGVTLHSRDTTWSAIAAINTHPCADELQAYLKWKREHSLA